MLGGGGFLQQTDGSRYRIRKGVHRGGGEKSTQWDGGGRKEVAVGGGRRYNRGVEYSMHTLNFITECEWFKFCC